MFLSYTCFSPHDLKFILPAAELLNEYREMTEGETGLLSYADFESKFSETGSTMVQAGYYPAEGGPVLGETDFWLMQAKKNNIQLKGEIKRIYQHLADAIEILDARRSPEISAYDGKIEPLKGRDGQEIFIGWKNTQRGFSPSSLEVLGKCPFRFFVEYILNLKHLEPRQEGKNQWLSPAERGTLLHNIFEDLLNATYPDGQVCKDQKDCACTPELEKIAQKHLERQKTLLRPENEQIYAAEAKSLLDTCHLFREMELNAFDEFTLWSSKHEVPFEGIEIQLENGKTISLRGRIDRVAGVIENVDKSTGEHKDFPERNFVKIIDYKTGKDKEYNKPFKGGRKLQALLYALAYEKLDEKAVVTECGYVFVNNKAEKPDFFYNQEEYREIIRKLLTQLYLIMEQGRFVVTEDEEDCKNCDYQSLCSRQLLDRISEKREKTPAKVVRCYE